MLKTLTCRIAHSPSSYPITISPGLVGEGELLASHLKGLAVKFAMITTDSLASIYGIKLCKMLAEQNIDLSLLTFPSGEIHKNRTTKSRLEDQLLDNGFGRDSGIIALGGGVVTDMAGYIAATYCRGLSLIMLPTSLMAMVDAAIGGKNGLNVSAGKNLIGSIYPPSSIFIDPQFLITLSSRELSCGIAEMLKHGLIADSAHFNYLENNVEGMLGRDSTVVANAIYDSCKIKTQIVEEDEKENGKRRLLNFGHTVGHALEKLSAYQLPHGEAVALGILVESRIAYLMGSLSQRELGKIEALLKRYKLPLKASHPFEAEAMQEAMRLDKKSKGGTPRFVIIDAIGHARSCEGEYCCSVDQTMLAEALSSIKGGHFERS